MPRRVRYFILLVLSTMCWSSFAHAGSKLTAMVIGNTAVRPEASEQPSKDGLDKLKQALVRYSDDPLGIVEASNASNTHLSQLVDDFSAHAGKADVVLVLYSGEVGHDDRGETYLVPGGWSGDDRALTPLSAVLDPLLRSGAKGKILVFIDEAKPSFERTGRIVPGGGHLTNWRADEIELFYASSANLIGRLSSLIPHGTLRPVRLAALVQQDIMFDSGGAIIPNITGSVQTASLDPLEDDKLKENQSKCVAALRDDPKSNIAVASAKADERGGVETLAAPLDQNSGIMLASGRWGWSCPFGFGPPPSKEKDNKAKDKGSNTSDSEKPSTSVCITSCKRPVTK